MFSVLCENYAKYIIYPCFEHKVPDMSTTNKGDNSMSNVTNNEYDGSTRVRVFINKLISVSSVDNATSRIKTRFDVLLNERAKIKDQQNNETDLEKRANLVDADKMKVAELTKLLEDKKQLIKKRQELLSAREAEIQNYQPMEINW